MEKLDLKGLFILGLTVGLMSTMTNIVAGSPDSGPEAVADQFHTALAEGDEATINALLDPNVLIYESGGVESSLEEYASHHMHSDMKFLANMEREIASREVMNNENMAVVSTRSKLAGSYQDSQLELASTETLVMRKDERGWRVHHIHWSSKSSK